MEQAISGLDNLRRVGWLPVHLWTPRLHLCHQYYSTVLTFYYYNEIPKAGYFLKRVSLFFAYVCVCVLISVS